MLLMRGGHGKRGLTLGPVEVEELLVRAVPVLREVVDHVVALRAGATVKQQRVAAAPSPPPATLSPAGTLSRTGRTPDCMLSDCTLALPLRLKAPLRLSL